MTKQKYLFIDRDGTLLVEPADEQIDSLEKFELVSNVIPALLKLKQAGFTLVVVSNQDGLGGPTYCLEAYEIIQSLLLRTFASQGIQFEAVRICPHLASSNCFCRKPQIELVMDYVINQKIDRLNSYVIGDRDSDLAFADQLGIRGFKLTGKNTWNQIANAILEKPRRAEVHRKTNETEIYVHLNLDFVDSMAVNSINTGIGFFDHMLDQLAKHGGFHLTVLVKGDLHIDDHHTVEDVALSLGQAMSTALGDKRGIGRYGFLLPMDESLAHIALDLSGRPYFVFEGNFPREQVGKLSTELVPHFFRSFSTLLEAALHIKIKGENTHHMVEAIFKGVGKTLKQAIQKRGNAIPSTKGVL